MAKKKVQGDRHLPAFFLAGDGHLSEITTLRREKQGDAHAGQRPHGGDRHLPALARAEVTVTFPRLLAQR